MLALRSDLPGRAAMLLTLAFVGIVILLALGGPAAAESLEARWTLYGRQDAVSFTAGSSPFTAGYEVVSFAGAGPTANLSAFTYAGADLTPPQPPIVACGATVAPTTLDLRVDGAYPYAGCVFFIGVHNTGDHPIHVDLAALDTAATVTCDAPGCLPSDVDVLAGGPDTGTIASLCRSLDGEVTNAGTRYAIPAGATFVCPMFVTVLQPAKENARYIVKITPPPLDGDPDELQTPTASPSSVIATHESPFVPPRGSGDVVQTPTPTVPRAEATSTPTPTATPTAVETVAGARTPGAGSTPLAPSTGSGGELIQRAPGASGINPLIVLAAGAALLSALAWAYRAKLARDLRRDDSRE